MKIVDINPHIRFAERFFFKNKPEKFNVFDSRIICVISGEINIEIDNCKYNLKENMSVYFASGCIYTISSEKGCELYSINFDLSQSRNNITEALAPFKINSKNPPKYKAEKLIEDCEFLNSHLVIKDNYLLFNRIKNIVNEFFKKEIYYREKSSAILKHILIDIYRQSLKTTENSTIAVEKVISYIDNNYDKKIVNSVLAEFTGYHEYHLNRIFKKQTGKTIHKYIFEVRINEAKRFIMTTDLSLFEIAEVTGFSSDTHLSNSFKNYFGYSPSEYKQNFKNRI